uniref:Uncharacterized protein n=1 Tax=Oryza brachyantha TaxID=4533 RepID=J3NEJ0_ORYBR
MQKLHENTLCGAEVLGGSDSKQFAASASVAASSGDPFAPRVRLSHVALSSCSPVSSCSELSLFTDDSSAGSIFYHVSGSGFWLSFAAHVWCIFFQFSDGFIKDDEVRRQREFFLGANN